jgi:hypothetical protein
MDVCYPGWRSNFTWSGPDEVKALGHRLIRIGREAKAHFNAITGRRGRLSEQDGGNP